jgi:hypothetical protein
MQANQLMQAIRFLLSVVALACLFGVALDLVTAHVWVDYFTLHHPKVVESKSPIVMALVWGVGASWWFGAVAAGILWWFNRRRPHPVPAGTLIRWTARAMVVLWLVMMAVLGGIYALIGLLPMEARRPTFDIDRRAMAVALTHQTEYVLGAIVLIVLMVLVARRSRIIARAATPAPRSTSRRGG